MPVVSKPVLKSYFNDGDIPGEDQYIDLIDTMGEGDMTKAVYDTNDDGSVDSADDADTLDTLHASSFHREDQDLIANGYDIRTSQGVYVGDISGNPDPGDVDYTGDLQAIRSSVLYPVYPVVPLPDPATSSSWDASVGYSTQTTPTEIDLSSVFGLPDGVKGIFARIWARDVDSPNASTYYFALQGQTTGPSPLVARPSGLPANYWAENSGFVPCNSSGNVYYKCVASGTETLYVGFIITGYII